jgi:hypothetical protein
MKRGAEERVQLCFAVENKGKIKSEVFGRLIARRLALVP